jgi:hypothetical protein
MSDSPRTRNTSRPAAPRATAAEWQPARLAVLERLDIRQECNGPADHVIDG